MEVQDIMLEVQSSRNPVESVVSVVDELFQILSVTLGHFLVSNQSLNHSHLQLQLVCGSSECSLFCFILPL